MSSGTNVAAAFRRKIALSSARLEAYLTTHAFEILFFVIFIVANILQFIWGAHDEFYHTIKAIEKDNPTWTDFKWYIAIARGGGYILNLNCAIIIILASRKLLTALRDTPLHNVLPLDKTFPAAHIVVGWSILIGVIIHVPFHMAWIFKFNQLGEFTWWSFTMSFTTGVCLLLVFLIMFILALPRYRKKFFRLFMVSHLVGASLMFILLIFHGMYRNKPETYKWILPAMIIYSIDRIIRRLQISNVTLELSGAHTTLKPGGIIEIAVPKPFNYRAGQYAEIAVPELSKEWHPFTIASAPHEHDMVFYIKQSGDWTKKLGEAFQNRIDGNESLPLSVRVRGPFGAPAQHTKNYKRVVLISGGIGATPFAAISKHLQHKAENAHQHHRAADIQDDPDYYFDDEKVFYRLNRTVGKLYDLQVDGKPLHQILKAENAKRISETLTLDSVANPRLSGATSFYSSSSNELESSDHTVLDIQEDAIYPRRFPQLNRLCARLLAFLHTTRFVFLLLLSLIARFAIVCIVAIWRRADFGFGKSTMDPDMYWAVGTDAILGLLLTLVMAVTLSLEISYMRTKFFDRVGRCIDLFAFLPLSILSTALTFASWAQPDARGALTVIHFALFLPLLFILLSYRLYRSIGSKNLLDTGAPRCGCPCGHSAPDVDFVWTTPNSDADQWLRESLNPLAGGTDLRLHRYVTREKQVNKTDSHIDSHIGRPDWQSFFSSVADKTRSGSDVGVFFCGPVPMGAAIQKALRQVEVQSNLRGGYLAVLSDNDVARDFAAKSSADVHRLRRYGCNVRFVFREENFS